MERSVAQAHTHPSTILIEALDVGKVYPRVGNDLVALDGVSLAVERGSFLTITGPSGSGKSTLLNLLGCLDRPTQGRILLEGVDLAGLDDRAASRVRNQRVGFLFQSFNLIPQMNVVENVETALLYSERPELEWRKRSLGLLERLGILDRASHRPAELSMTPSKGVNPARCSSSRNRPSSHIPPPSAGSRPVRAGSCESSCCRSLTTRLRPVVVKCFV